MYRFIHFENGLLTGREAAWRGVAGNALGAASGSPPKPGKMGLLHKTRDFCGLVRRVKRPF